MMHHKKNGHFDVDDIRTHAMPPRLPQPQSDTPIKLSGMNKGVDMWS